MIARMILTHSRRRPNVRRILCVPLHGDDVEVVAVDVERVGDVVGNALIDQHQLNHVVEANEQSVDALAEFLSQRTVFKMCRHNV